MKVTKTLSLALAALVALASLFGILSASSIRSARAEARADVWVAQEKNPQQIAVAGSNKTLISSVLKLTVKVDLARKKAIATVNNFSGQTQHFKLQYIGQSSTVPILETADVEIAPGQTITFELDLVCYDAQFDISWVGPEDFLPQFGSIGWVIFAPGWCYITPSATMTNTSTNTPVPPTATSTSTATATATATKTRVPPTATPTNTPTSTPTNTPTATPTSTSVAATATATKTISSTATSTATPTSTPTNTPVAPTATNTPAPAPTWSASATPPTAIKLLSFKAEYDNSNVKITWTTGEEINTFGFMVYRDGVPFLREIVPAKGASEYVTWDMGGVALSNHVYTLVEIETSGNQITHQSIQYIAPIVDDGSVTAELKPVAYMPNILQ